MTDAPEKTMQIRSPTLHLRWARRPSKDPKARKPTPWWKPSSFVPVGLRAFRLEQKWNVAYQTEDCGTGQWHASEEWLPVPHEDENSTEELFMPV